jgi:site-specific DNA-methyltransferase (adenine-specific)
MIYQVVYADPPWLYDNAGTQRSRGMARSAYECMPTEEIKALPVASITDENCLLFLWATMPKLREALEVIEAWSFKYITCAFVWIKLNPSVKNTLFFQQKDIYSGLGHWVNGNAELVLLDRKGKPNRAMKNVKQIVTAARGRHSEKPEEVRRRIDLLVGDVKKIELFARKEILGWITIGNGIDNKDIKESLKELACKT